MSKGFHKGKMVEVAYYLVGAPKGKDKEVIIAGPFDSMTTIVDAMDEAGDVDELEAKYNGIRVVKGFVLAPEVNSDGVWADWNRSLPAGGVPKTNTKTVKLHGDGNEH